MSFDAQKFADGLHEWVAKEVVRPLVRQIKAIEEENKSLRERVAVLEYQATEAKGRAKR